MAAAVAAAHRRAQQSLLGTGVAGAAALGAQWSLPGSIRALLLKHTQSTLHLLQVLRLLLVVLGVAQTSAAAGAAAMHSRCLLNLQAIHRAKGLMGMLLSTLVQARPVTHGPATSSSITSTSTSGTSSGSSTLGPGRHSKAGSVGAGSNLEVPAGFSSSSSRVA